MSKTRRLNLETQRHLKYGGDGTLGWAVVGCCDIYYVYIWFIYIYMDTLARSPLSLS